jgi:hypothetical protein
MNKLLSYIPLLIALATPLILVACDSSTITEPSQVIFPDSGVSFGRHVLPLFELGCAASGCHNEIDQAGDLSLVSYFHLFRRPGIVRPGDSTNSVLGQIVGGRLPHIEAPISLLINRNQRRGIQIWIQEGASNN